MRCDDAFSWEAGVNADRPDAMFGCASQNGPIHLDANQQPFENTFSWDRVADYIWIDQPV